MDAQHIHAVSWFEIPVEDFERARKFYSTIFDYEMPTQDFEGTKMGILPYDQDKGIGGAIAKSEHHTPAKEGVALYLTADPDLSAVLDRIEDAGGSVITGKSAVGNQGYVAIFDDTEGNRLGLHSNG